MSCPPYAWLQWVGEVQTGRAQLTGDELSSQGNISLSVNRIMLFRFVCEERREVNKKKGLCVCRREIECKVKGCPGESFLHAWHLLLNELDMYVMLWDFDVEGTNNNMHVAVVPCVVFPQNHSRRWRPHTWVLYQIYGKISRQIHPETGAFASIAFMSPSVHETSL